MNVTAVYINTHRYDYMLTCICVASVRYWYPGIDIYLIKDLSSGRFKTTNLERKWGVKIFQSERKEFGWGYGKLETLFIKGTGSFLVIDADTVMTGPVIEVTKSVETDFLVDDEVQPIKKFCQLYYDLKRINEISRTFVYPGYSFNTGQWFGTYNIITRKDFEPIINWTAPPTSKFPAIIFQGEQGHLNFLLQEKELQKKITIKREKIMIWPAENNADFIDIEKIKHKESAYPYIIHWAGMKFNDINAYPRADILKFYLSFFYAKLSTMQQLKEKIRFRFLPLEKWVRFKFVKK